MPITRVLTYTRPSINIPLFKIPESVLLHYKDTYGMISRRVFSEDRLTATVTDIFTNQEEFDRFIADPIRCESIKDIAEYNTQLGISLEITITESA
jgi:hypothetical protein